jgi:hypothetical protein
MLKKGDGDNDEVDDELRTTELAEPCDSNTRNWGILPQDSASIALPTYQQRGVGGDRK